jgi:hypothetical protein
MATSPAHLWHSHRILQFPERHAPRHITVSTSNAADHASIQDAIDAARAGDTIVIDAGMYIESLVIDKPVHLVGPNDPRFADEEIGSSDESPCALIIGTGSETISWSAKGGSIHDIAISRVAVAGDDGSDALVRLHDGELQLKRCVLADGAHHGVVIEDGTATITRCHIRNVNIGVAVNSGGATLQRTHIEGFEGVAVQAEPGVEISLEDNCFEGRTVIRATVRAFCGNDIDTLFVDETLPTSGNRVGSLVHLCAFRHGGDVAVGI